MSARPRILITLDTGADQRRGVSLLTFKLKQAYVRAVERAGGLPVLAAPTKDETIISSLAELMDGLVVTGGDFDIPPQAYRAEQKEGLRIDAPKPERTGFEWALIEQALENQKPILGICGGMQLLNVVLGGTLLQDIGAEIFNPLEHEQPTSPLGPAHAVELQSGGLLPLIKAQTIQVNTTHHQAIDGLGEGLRVEGRAPDGVIEAISTDDLNVIGVQWHPELLDDEVSRRLYTHLIQRAVDAR